VLACWLVKNTNVSVSGASISKIDHKENATKNSLAPKLLIFFYQTETYGEGVNCVRIFTEEK